MKIISMKLSFALGATVCGCALLSGCNKGTTAADSTKASQSAQQTAAAQADLYKQGKIGKGVGGQPNGNRYAPGGGGPPIPGGGGPPIPGGGGAPPGPPIPGGGPPR